MKRLLIITALLFAFVQLRASHMASELNLRMFDQSWFILTIDHQVFGTPVNHFKLQNLEPGIHYLSVSRLNDVYGPYAQPIVVYNGYIEIPVRSKINAMIDRQSRFKINKIFALTPVPVYLQPLPYHNPLQPYIGMTDFEFQQLSHTISDLSFESSKMQVAKQAITTNYFNSYQIADLMNLVTFESSKLEIAKAAYNKTLDKQNYYRVNEVFTFESSIEDLTSYILRSK